jgi:hypothetical protein
MARPQSLDEPARVRARRRAEWSVRSFRLGEEPGDDLSDTTTAVERLSMMWPLAVETWTLSGRPLPIYDRTNLPGRLFRPGEVLPDDSASS